MLLRHDAVDLYEVIKERTVQTQSMERRPLTVIDVYHFVQSPSQGQGPAFSTPPSFDIMHPLAPSLLLSTIATP